MSLDPKVPPHKTTVFWLIVALAALVPIAYPLAFPTHGPLWSQIVPSVFTFILAVCIGWFAVRRAQRGESSFTPRRIKGYIVLLVIALVCFILAEIFKNPR